MKVKRRVIKDQFGNLSWETTVTSTRIEETSEAPPRPDYGARPNLVGTNIDYIEVEERVPVKEPDGSPSPFSFRKRRTFRATTETHVFTSPSIIGSD